MERDYAELSLRVGLMCGAADRFLDSSYFGTKARQLRWELTPGVVEDLRQEILDMGVPETAITLAPEEEARIPAMVSAGMEMQDHIDNNDADVVFVEAKPKS